MLSLEDIKKAKQIINNNNCVLPNFIQQEISELIEKSERLERKLAKQKIKKDK